MIEIGALAEKNGHDPVSNGLSERPIIPQGSGTLIRQSYTAKTRRSYSTSRLRYINFKGSDYF